MIFVVVNIKRINCGFEERIHGVALFECVYIRLNAQINQYLCFCKEYIKEDSLSKVK